jgi:hypothetical protein
MKPRRRARAALIVVGAAIVVVQLITVERVNPPSSANSPLQAPAQIEASLHRACFDCHPNQARSPWYSRIAPASWLIARDLALDWPGAARALDAAAGVSREASERAAHRPRAREDGEVDRVGNLRADAADSGYITGFK